MATIDKGLFGKYDLSVCVGFEIKPSKQPFAYTCSLSKKELRKRMRQIKALAKLLNRLDRKGWQIEKQEAGLNMIKNSKLTAGYTPEYTPPPMPEVVQPKVVYLCDRQACKRAQTHGCNTGHYCKHTSKIEHAINFKQVADNVYEERFFMTVKRLLDFASDVMWFTFEDLNGYTFSLHRKNNFIKRLLNIEVVKIGVTTGGSFYVKLSEGIQ